VLSREDDDRLLGVHILGEHAGSLISEAVTVLEFEGSAEDIARTIHAHPTLCEAVKEAGLGAFEQSIHGF
jgi:dihydrolipoamide dehydrogenase